MAWNAHAHDGALHFFRRVATFKREIGGGATDTAQAVLFFPRLLASMRPDLLAATACALPLLRSREVRSRWAIPLACGAAQVGFLALGNARDGAPAHHSERALLATTFILACFAADVLVTALPALHARARGSVFALVTVLGVGWIINFRGVFGEAPGETPLDDRRAQIAEGARLRGSEHLVVTPCTYEHFALIASFGAPERVETLASSREAPSASCPRVERR
jgi:hypothetical protein